MKTTLRKQMRESRKLMTAEERQQQSEHITGLLEAQVCFQEARVVLAYAAMPDEVATMPLIEKWCEKKTFVLPVVQGDDLVLVAYEGPESLRMSKWGILEPQGVPFTNYDQIDLALIPGLAFDLQGSRMGFGRGFYDRLLSRSDFKNTLTCGLAFAQQIVPTVPMDEWDVVLKALATPQEFYMFNKVLRF
ncbi:MAG: 5-formyltetrahydrofolate cyclo-ligase [Bacteroidaceae bacterium]|nr:5-formyltetrahydrofolate cyclo-ligase [Bacteroidaceae bacterium]